MRQTDLSDLDAFAAVARTRNFRRAAALRGVSASALSQSVRKLEARLGVRLLNRTTRSVAPTEAGRRLLDQLEPALAEITAAVDQLQADPDTPAGTLRINAPEPAVDLVLGPMVASFLRAHPRVRLEIIAESRLVDIVAEGFDAGVRWGEDLALDMVAAPLGPPQRFVLAAAPSLIEAHGRPEHPEDLLTLPCLRFRFASGVVPAWEFQKDGKVLRVDPTGPLVTSSVALIRRAALDGLGFWATFDGWVAADVAAGRLITVLDDWLPPFPGPYLYYPDRRNAPPALRAFVDFAWTWKPVAGRGGTG